MRPPALLLAALALLALSGCGEDQAGAPAVFDVKSPRGESQARFPRVGLEMTRPRNWKLRRRDDPGVFELASGEAIVVGWAYPRDEPLPQTEGQMEAARRRLLEAIERRDAGFRVRASSVRQIAGAPAIEVVGRQVISKRELVTRSVHVFEGRIEYVIEGIAPPRDWRMVNRRVLRPLLASLTVTGEVAGDGE